MVEHKLKFIYANLLLALFVGGIYGQKTSNYTEQETFFLNGKDTIYGKLILPKQEAPDGDGYPVVIFIHGSGPEDYSSTDLYKPLWERFTKIGFACFSWDKPGVGSSQGNWFEQSIADRANLVSNAFHYLEQHDKLNPQKIGLWGISQAGWVIPKVVETIKPAFAIIVSGPVTTALDQEIYRLRSGLEAEGYSSQAIDSAVAYTSTIKNLVLDNKPFSEFEALQKEIMEHQWSSQLITGDEGIYNYLKVILRDDTPPRIENLTMPLLAIWGANDLLVPPYSSAQQYQTTMEKIGNNTSKVVILPQADHTMTLNNSGKREETIKRRKTYRGIPEKIFAPGYLDLMENWLKNLKF